MNLPYYCPGYSGDEPDEYLCPDTFIRAIYEEMYRKLKTGKKTVYWKCYYTAYNLLRKENLSFKMVGQGTYP